MKKHLLSSFLDGARKEAKELLAKFNARDESCSLMPVDGAHRAIKSPVIHRFPIRSILRNFAPTRIFTGAMLIQRGLLHILYNNLSHLAYFD